MFTFRTGKNPCLRLITRPGLPENPKRFFVPTFRTFDPGLRQDVNLFFKDDGFFLFLLLDNNSTPLLLPFLSTRVTDEKISLWQHQHLTFWTKLHEITS